MDLPGENPLIRKCLRVSRTTRFSAPPFAFLGLMETDAQEPRGPLKMNLERGEFLGRILDDLEAFRKPRPHHSSEGIDRRHRGRGHRLVAESDAEVGYEAPSVRIFD
jgi:hypothetical protein